MTLSKSKKIIIIAGVLVALLLAMNFPYLSARVKFIFRGYSQTFTISGQQSSFPEKIEPNILIIGSLGINAPVVYVEEKSEKVYQAALVNGVVHYPGTPLPGEAGNCYIFGHSSDYIWSKGKYKSVFALLPKIQKGTEIIISDKDGNKFVYTVTESFSVAANDVSVLNQDYTKKILTLQTSYPIGTALKRWIVKAEMELGNRE